MNASETTEEKTNSTSNDFLKIRLNSIHPSEPVPFDIYLRLNDRHVHYLHAGDTLSEEKLTKFEKKAPGQFYINAAFKQDYKNYVHDRMTDDRLQSHEKALILRESSMALVEELYENPDVNAALEGSQEVIQDFIEFMKHEPESMSHLISLSSHDFYTYNHSLDVSIYSLGLGQAIGYSPTELQELGEGSLLHDIGKRNVPVSIITKDGPLDDVEWAQMKKHPEYGLMILTEHGASDAVKACCFEHHESCLGNGYPQQLEADEIHPMARIIALTDTYDALTTQRSYNTPMTPRAALDFMNTKLAGRYDPDLLKAMYSVLFKMEQTAAQS